MNNYNTNAIQERRKKKCIKKKIKKKKDGDQIYSSYLGASLSL